MAALYVSEADRIPPRPSPPCRSWMERLANKLCPDDKAVTRRKSEITRSDLKRKTMEMFGFFSPKSRIHQL